MNKTPTSIKPRAATTSRAKPQAKPRLIDERGRSVDPVRMYLRKMGTISLLTREGEIEVAKRIETGENKVIDIVLNSPIAIPYVVDLCERVERSLVRVKDAFVIPAKTDEKRPGQDEEPTGQEAAIENMKIQLKRLRKHQRELDRIDEKLRELLGDTAAPEPLEAQAEEPEPEPEPEDEPESEFEPDTFDGEPEPAPEPEPEPEPESEPLSAESEVSDRDIGKRAEQQEAAVRAMIDMRLS